jgi:rod shape-determining protein MreC
VFVLALALCALVTAVRHGSRTEGGNDPITGFSRRYLFSPVLHLFNSFSGWWRDDVSSIFHGPNLAAENNMLRSRLANLMQENRLLAANASENVQLRALLYFKAHDPRDLLPAEVLALKPFPERDSAIFSRGIDNKVSVKEPALDENGNLVGQVTSVAANTCDIMLLTDTLSSVGARVVHLPPPAIAKPPVTSPAVSTSTSVSESVNGTPATTQTSAPVAGAAASQQPDARGGPAPVGICMGDHSTYLQLTDIAPDANIAVGDTVVTSGLGGVYPKDIPIGKIVEVDFDKTRYLKSAVVAPWADFNHLQEGFIVR